MNENSTLVAVQIDKEQYSKLVKDTLIFQSTNFLELNKNKVDELVYLSINKGESARFAVCFGVVEGIAKCPFSSPCGYPVMIKKNLSIKYYDEALEAIDYFAKNKGWNQIRFVLPPLFYAKEELTAWTNSMFRHNYAMQYVDVNYAFDLKKVYADDYEKNIQHNARKNLRIALSSGLELHECLEQNEIIEAYGVIAENRASKGYPLHMSLEQVLSTIKIVNSNVFLVKKDNINVAAALVYTINNEIAQVIYWGDRPGYSELKTINFLSYNLIKYYGYRGYSILDIGISTVESEPN